MRFSNLIDAGIAMVVVPIMFSAGILGLRWYADALSEPGPAFETLMGFFAVLGLAAIIVGVPVGMTLVVYAIVRSARSSEQRRIYEQTNTPTAI